MRNRSRKPLEDRFWPKVNKSGKLILGEPCWDWTGKTAARNNYGQLRVVSSAGKWIHEYAHRISFELANGAIPLGMFVLHDCDNPRCVNPDHLHLGTPRQNAVEARDRGLLKVARGEQQGNARLTEGQVLEIRQRVGATTRKQLAAEFGVHHSTIDAVISRRQWAWLP